MNHLHLPGATLLTCGLLALAPTGHAADNPDAHVHGDVQLDFAIENGDLSVWLVSPAANLVGFEREPATAGEKSAVANAISALESFSPVLDLPSTMGCEVLESHAELVTEGDGHDEHAHGDENAKDGQGKDEHAHENEHAADEHGKDEHAHGHEDEHGDEHESHDGHDEAHADHEDGKEHAEFEARFSLRCENFDTATISTNLFDTFPGIERVMVRGVLPDRQIGQTLTPGDTDIRLD